VIETIQLGVSVARIELLDSLQMDAVNRYSKTKLPGRGHIVFLSSMDSTSVTPMIQAAFVESLTAEHGGRGFQWATRLEDREKLWEARHAALYASLALRPGSKAFVTDVCVPSPGFPSASSRPSKTSRTQRFRQRWSATWGDGNFHMICMLDPSSEAETDVAHRLMDRMVTRGTVHGGTCTGEHGIGYGKMNYMAAEHGSGCRCYACD